jgi:hypothetical protein
LQDTARRDTDRGPEGPEGSRAPSLMDDLNDVLVADEQPLSGDP